MSDFIKKKMLKNKLKIKKNNDSTDVSCCASVFSPWLWKKKERRRNETEVEVYQAEMKRSPGSGPRTRRDEKSRTEARLISANVTIPLHC